MSKAICRECKDKEFDYDLKDCIVNIYSDETCHHITLKCPAKHTIRLHINVAWLAQAQAKIAPHKLQTHYHDPIPADVLELAKKTWEVRRITDEIRHSIDRFGETGLIL